MRKGIQDFSEAGITALCQVHLFQELANPAVAVPEDLPMQRTWTARIPSGGTPASHAIDLFAEGSVKVKSLYVASMGSIF